MPEIRITTAISAPIERCFDAARNIDLHVQSMAGTGERAVSGVTSGLIRLGQEVTWQGKHFGVRQNLTSRITRFDRPHSFRDSMVRGAFRRFDHDHLFEERGGITQMTDVFEYDVPLGWLGKLADILILRSYMTRLLTRRAEAVRRAVE